MLETPKHMQTRCSPASATLEVPELQLYDNCTYVGTGIQGVLLSLY